MAAPEEWRCSRNNGQRWRCKKPCKEGETLCAHHYAEKIAKRGRRISNLGGPPGGQGGISSHRPSNTSVEGSSEGLKPDAKEDSFPSRISSSASDGELSPGKGKKMDLHANLRYVKDLEYCMSQPMFTDVSMPVAQEDDPTMKVRTADVCLTDDKLFTKAYKRRNTATFVSEKQKRRRLAAHVSSGNDEESLMKPSIVDGNVSLTPNEKEKTNFGVTEDDDLSLTKDSPTWL